MSHGSEMGSLHRWIGGITSTRAEFEPLTPFPMWECLRWIRMMQSYAMQSLPTRPRFTCWQFAPFMSAGTLL